MARVARVVIIMELLGTGLWGAGRETFEADATTYRMFRLGADQRAPGLPVVPGSYLKGLLRTAAYKIAGLLINAGILVGIDPAAQGCWIGSTCGKCVVCRVFGSSGRHQSPLYVSPLYPVRREVLNRLKDALWHELDVDELLSRLDLLAEPNLTYLAHVRIDDRCGKAAEGGLFVIEGVEPTAVFLGEVKLYEAFLPGDGLDLVRALRLILLSLAQLNYSFVGRRTRAKISVLKHELPPEAEQDDVCKEVLRDLEWRVQ